MIIELTLMAALVAAVDCDDCAKEAKTSSRPIVVPGPVCAYEDKFPVAGAYFDERCEPAKAAILLPGDIWFEFGIHKLSKAGEKMIPKLVEMMSDTSGRRYYLDGHTDWIGSTLANYELSMKRATTVRDALVAAGISTDRLTTRGFGEERPVASNKSARGRAQNRRVEFVPFDNLNGAVLPDTSPIKN